MEDPLSTPRLPQPAFKPGATSTSKEQFSSSPGFGTPAYPIKPPQAPPLRQAFAAVQKASTSDSGPSVLSIALPPQTLRPVAFRTLTKKHNLTLTSSGLGLLSTFVGKFCGSGWREEGLAERVLDEIAKQWKRQGAGIIVEDGPDKKLTAILKILEQCMFAGKLDTGKLSRTSSSVGSLSRVNSLDVRPDLSRDDSQTSFGVSGLDVQDGDEADDQFKTHYRDVRPFLKVISAFQQPRLSYSTAKKTIEMVNGDPSLLPPIQSKIAMFRNRYHIVQQRLLRNESFQTPSFAGSRPPHLSRAGSSITPTQSYKVTPISNLLGRSGTEHLLLGLLAHTPASDLAVTDLSGSVVVDISKAEPVPRDGSYFTAGMIVLVHGTYEEDGSNSSSLTGSGVGGQIKGRFQASSIAGPPTERRDVTVGIGQSLSSDTIQTSVGAGFGWVDFLGVGSEKALGPQMRRLQSRLLASPAHSETAEARRSKIAIIAECHLDSPRTLDALRAIFTSYTTSKERADLPLSIVLMGNFVSSAAMAGSAKGGSVEYKEHFDALASLLAEFPQLLSSTTFVFVPGDNDPWASTFSKGATTLLPQMGLPELLTSRVRRAVATANQEADAKDGEKGEVVWASNPARVTLFGPVEELVLFRDDISGRMRRNAINFTPPEKQKARNKDQSKDGSMGQPTNNDPPTNTHQPDEMDTSESVESATSHLPTSAQLDLPTQIGRRITKTLLDQAHLSPFPPSLRPVAWEHGSALSLYPLPTALVIADAEAPSFCVTYEGCHVMNPGRVVERGGERRGVCRWIEYEVGGGRGRKAGKGVVREGRF